MRNKIIFQVAMCVVALLSFVLPVSAQQSDETSEYEVALKKLMEVTGALNSIDEILPQTLAVARMNAPQKDADYWDTFAKSWREKMERMVMEIYMPIYKKHLALEDLQETIAFYESPLGKRYRESAISIMREAMPLLVSRLQVDMRKELHPESDRSMDAMEQTRNRDQELYDAAYALPKDSIEVAKRPYNRAEGTKPSLYSIERRAKDTKVTFLQPIYFNWQWLYYSPGFVIIDKKTGDEYHVRGYDGGAPQDRLLTVEGFNSKYIYVSLLFPKLKKSVEVIDILELPHEKDRLPSNDDGIFKTYCDVKVKDYLRPSKKRTKEIY